MNIIQAFEKIKNTKDIKIKYKNNGELRYNNVDDVLVIYEPGHANLIVPCKYLFNYELNHELITGFEAQKEVIKGRVAAINIVNSNGKNHILVSCYNNEFTACFNGGLSTKFTWTPEFLKMDTWYIL